MTTEIFENLKSSDVSKWGQEPLHLRHRLHQTDLFTDDSLADLIERLPQMESPVVLMPPKEARDERWSYCDRSGLTGHEVLDAIRHGRLWINMLSLQTIDPRFERLLEAIFDEIGTVIPDFSPFRKSIGLLISSPNNAVSYHADLPGQSLWQIRGRKRIYIYPPTQPFLRHEEIENIARGVQEEELSYDPSFDAFAQTYDLTEGDMLHWPLNGPHRVENADCLNVSVTTEHWTPTPRRSFAMNYGNGILRRELGWKPKSRALAGPAFWAKVALTVAWRKAGLQSRTSFKRVMTSRVDPSAPDGYRPFHPSPAE
ncbi:MAG: hypothetical protein CML99_14480 [Rhodobiaceae bacterium]|nr:hypothetical protein [Rhodobiaceae bacterium]